MFVFICLLFNFFTTRFLHFFCIKAALLFLLCHVLFFFSFYVFFPVVVYTLCSWKVGNAFVFFVIAVVVIFAHSVCLYLFLSALRSHTLMSPKLSSCPSSLLSQTQRKTVLHCLFVVFFFAFFSYMLCIFAFLLACRFFSLSFNCF